MITNITTPVIIINTPYINRDRVHINSDPVSFVTFPLQNISTGDLRMKTRSLIASEVIQSPGNINTLQTAKALNRPIAIFRFGINKAIIRASMFNIVFMIIRHQYSLLSLFNLLSSLVSRNIIVNK